MFFNLGWKHSFISDSNHELITAYSVIKESHHELVKLLEKHKKKHCDDYFYQVRKNPIFGDPTAATARFIYLNKSCYNGLYRVNKKNEFNVPFGKYTNPNIVDYDNLMRCHNALQRVDVKHQNYDQIKPSRDDLVYFDPPYHETFTGYTPNRFSEKQQIELRQFCDELTKNGVMFVLSSSDTDFIRDQYNAYSVIEIIAPRSINCKANGRKRVKELLIVNYCEN